MTVDELIAARRDRGAALAVEGGGLRYLGPKLPADDPIRAAIGEHRAVLLELFAYAPGGRCDFAGCYRLLAEGDKIACPDHRRQLNTAPMPWDARRVGREVPPSGSGSRRLPDPCPNGRPANIDRMLVYSPCWGEGWVPVSEGYRKPAPAMRGLP